MSQQGQQGRQLPPTEREIGLIEASEARADLYDTLGQLRVQLDYAQRIDDGVARAQGAAGKAQDDPATTGQEIGLRLGRARPASVSCALSKDDGGGETGGNGRLHALVGFDAEQAVGGDGL